MGTVIGQILLTSLLMFLLVGSLLGALVGLGLMLQSEATFAFFGAMNRWVSTRRALRLLEVPYRVDPGPVGSGRWVGAVLLAVGGYSLAVLLRSVPAARVASILHADPTSLVAVIGIEWAKWFLVAGCVAGVATGVLLLFFPAAWRAVEMRANRWHSMRNFAPNADRMHLSLDRAVAAFPRASGATILALSVVSTVASALLLLR